MRALASLVLAPIVIASGCAARSTVDTAKAVPVRDVAAPAEPVTPSVDAQEPANGIVHVVQPGQTLWRIAHAYGIDLAKLADVNGIQDPARVEVGTPIFVPGATATIDIAAYPAPLPKPSATEPAASAAPSADFLWPVDKGEFMRPFGEPRRHHVHAGVDIRGMLGQDILAAKDGTVAFGGRTGTGYGNMVVLDHGDGVQTLYAHAQKVLVTPGEAVKRGQPIALLGRTGNATTEHCHFEIRLQNHAVDPMPYLGVTQARR